MAEEQQNLFSATLRGEITRIIYENDDQTYTVLRLLTDDGEKTVVGTIPQVAAGQHLEVTGRWEKHAEFGSQFRSFSFRPVLPSTSTGIVRFLSSGAIPGVGEKTAKAIVDYFGADTLEVLEKFSKRLREVPKISDKKAAAIAAAWHESASRRDTFIYLQGLGITPAYCNRLYQQYGNLASEVVRANPYRLAEEVDGIGFLKADEIAAGLGIAKDSPERLTAAAVYQMNQLTGNGHVGYPEEQFDVCVAELSGLEPAKARIGINRALERRLLVRQHGMLYAPALARAERELPELIGRLAAAKTFAGQHLRRDDRENVLTLSDEQRLACDRVAVEPLTIITGGPGVGKTTVIGEIVRRAPVAELKIAAAAPTGRAAKRLSETTGLTAKTLHRMLMFDPKTGRFGFDETNPLQCDLLIVDEVSMLDILLALALFRAIRPGCSVILVGDRDQLPSVGPGTVFADLIGSGIFLTTHLTRVFRQAEGSRIIRNAHRINRGLLPEKTPPSQTELSDFYWVEQDDPERTLELIAKLILERIPERFRLDPVNDVQVLSPMNRGSCGTIELNRMLQHLLNGGDKPQFKAGERTIKSGDKVMQSSNNYDKGVFNGDMGRVLRIESGKKKFQVAFDGSIAVDYNFDEADEIMPAYAITVHKSQGSEFPAVILPMLSQHYMMLQRNLLYTAVTRARKLLVLIGSAKAIQAAVRNTRLAPRYSKLAEELAEVKAKLHALGRN